MPKDSGEEGKGPPLVGGGASHPLFHCVLSHQFCQQVSVSLFTGEDLRFPEGLRHSPRHELWAQAFAPLEADPPPRGLLLRPIDIQLLHSDYEYIIKGLDKDGGSVLEKTLQT